MIQQKIYKLHDFYYFIPGRKKEKPVDLIAIIEGDTGVFIAYDKDLEGTYPPPSLTNSIEHLHKALEEKFIKKGEKIILVEASEKEEDGKCHYSLVTFDKTRRPSWHFLGFYAYDLENNPEDLAELVEIAQALHEKKKTEEAPPMNDNIKELEELRDRILRRGR